MSWYDHSAPRPVSHLSYDNTDHLRPVPPPADHEVRGGAGLRTAAFGRPLQDTAASSSGHHQRYRAGAGLPNKLYELPGTVVMYEVRLTSLYYIDLQCSSSSVHPNL